MRPRLALALAAAGLLAACGPKPDRTVTADQLPRIKTGQWEVTTIANGAQQAVVRSCSSGRLPLPMTVTLFGCNAQPKLTLTGSGAVRVDMSCATSFATSTEHATISGDFNSSFVSENQLTLVDRQTNRPTVTDVRQTYRYVGSCPS